MSRILELKKQNTNLDISLIDALNQVLPKSKYVDLMINLVKNKLKTYVSKEEMIENIKMSFGLDVDESLKDKDNAYVYALYRILDIYFSHTEFTSFLRFIDLNEKKLIENSDLSTYKNFEEIGLQLSLSELKQLDKELEKQVRKLYEDDEWLVLKPMTWESSKKYGANTKWCTASENDEDYFYKYARNGILIYSMSKKTGIKVAGYKDITNEGEISFWNIKDKRIDSMESQLPIYVMQIFKNEFTNGEYTNWDLMTPDEQSTILLMLDSRRLKKVRYDDVDVIPPIGEYENEAALTPVIPIRVISEIDIINEIEDMVDEELDCN